jgi:hypothetical protein
MSKDSGKEEQGATQGVPVAKKKALTKTKTLKPTRETEDTNTPKQPARSPKKAPDALADEQKHQSFFAGLQDTLGDTQEDENTD